MDVLTSFLLICAAGLTLAWLLAAQRRLVAHLARRFLSLPRQKQALAVFAICILTVCAQKQDREIIESSNNRIIESAEASASGPDDSRRAAANAEVETVAPQAEEESLSNRNSIIQTFDYSIIGSISAQIELFPNGDFITRSNNVERVYCWVDVVVPQANATFVFNAEISEFGRRGV